MGDIVVDPVRRQSYRFARDGDDLLAEVETDPGGDVPEHVHPAQTEWWEVVEGNVTFFVDGERRPAKAGEQVRADAGMRHSFINDGNERAILNVRVSPAGELQAFLTEAARYAAAGMFDARGKPSSIASAIKLWRLVIRFRNDIQITTPAPARLLNLLLRALPQRAGSWRR